MMLVSRSLDRTKLLRFSKDLFGINDPSATDSEKSSMQFMAQACVEEMDLLAAQLTLEEKANAKSWGRSFGSSTQRFLGVLVVELLRFKSDSTQILDVCSFQIHCLSRH
jgi:hypothetical protein